MFLGSFVFLNLKLRAGWTTFALIFLCDYAIFLCLFVSFPLYVFHGIFLAF